MSSGKIPVQFSNQKTTTINRRGLWTTKQQHLLNGWLLPESGLAWPDLVCLFKKHGNYDSKKFTFFGLLFYGCCCCFRCCFLFLNKLQKKKEKLYLIHVNLFSIKLCMKTTRKPLLNRLLNS